MALNLVLIQQRQSASGVALSWTPIAGASAHQIFVASRRMTPEELEAAAALQGTDECLVARLGAEVTSVVDDVTPPGEPRHYGVAMVFGDGTVRPARFRTLPEGGSAESAHLSAFRKGPAPPRTSATLSTAAPGSGGTSSLTAQPTPAPDLRVGTAAEDPLEARKRAQREARARVLAQAPAAQAPATAAPPAAARAPGPESRSPDSDSRPQPARTAEPPPPPASIPLQGPLDLRMQGATQTWDGLRIFWDRDPRAAAYEIIASDHQLFGEELADALAGRADFTTATAVGPAITCVIDNTTPREARGWYAVLARSRDGHRTPHPFKLGDATASGRAAAPFLNPNRTGELRAEVEALLAEARDQFQRWKSEQDGGARREAKRVLGDALLIWPDDPAAKALLADVERG
jgi:hypothetical protein